MRKDSLDARHKHQRFSSKRAYRRWLKRQADGGTRQIVGQDTRSGLEALEQRVLLSASPVFELSDLLSANGGNGSEGVIINGISLGDRSGVSVSSAGDVNGDGFDDVLIGAFRDGPNGVDSGSSFVVFGQAGGFNASLQLSSLNGSNGFRINGIAAGDLSGRSVASAGDINGDGFDDLLIGAFSASPNGAQSGQAYVVYGKAGAFATSLELSALSGTDGFSIDGLSAGDQLGFSVRGAGDVNADGLDDFILGASLASPNGAASGTAYVVFGQAGGFGSSFDLNTLSGSNGFVINGVSADDQLGISVNAAGDVNDDGIADVVVGAFQDDPNGADSGTAFVVFGATSGFAATLDPSTLNGTNGFIINGETSLDNAGRSVSSAGDFNGDGFADVLIGASAADGSAAASGSAYVVFGHGGVFTSSLNLSALTGADGFKLNGIDAGDRAGLTVSAAGDVNGDGLDDLLVAADRGNPNGTRSGETYLVFGQSVVSASINLSALAGADGFVLNGIDAQDRSATSIRAAGDVDGDGFSDFIIGAFLADPNGGESGESYLVFGADFSDAVTHQGSALADGLLGTGGADVIVAGRGNDMVTGSGGADVILAGQGDDEVVIGDITFKRVDGGSGADTLKLDGTGLTLDLTSIADSRITGIEVIDISGGTNTLTLDLQEVLNLSGTSNTLRVIRDINGTINFGAGWTQTGSQVVGDDQETTLSQGNATLIILVLGDILDPVVTVDPLVTETRSPEITGTITDLDPALTLEVTVNGTAYPATVNGDGTWTLSAGTITSDLADGVYDVQAVGTDSSGNSGSDQTAGELIIDNVVPVVTVDTLMTNLGSPELTGTVVDLDPGTTINVNVNGITYPATNNGDGTWTLPAGDITPDLGDGIYEVVVTATDTPGHVGMDGTVNELMVDAIEPDVTIVAPGTTDNTSPELTGTVDDIVDAAPVVEVTVNGVTYEATNNGDDTWTLAAGTIATLPEGTYTVSVTATDESGNVGVLSETVELTINTAPVATVDTLTTSDQRPQLTGTVVDADPAVDVIVTVTVNGIPYTAINNGDGTWTLPDNTILGPDALPDGTYDVSVSATDAGGTGNTGTDTSADELTIDTTTPAVTVNSLSTQDLTPELTGTVSDTGESIIQVTVDGIAHTAINNGDGTWTLADGSITLALVEGTYDVAVTATNLAEIPGIGTDATTDELNIDLTDPVVTINAPGTTGDSSPELTGAVTDDVDAAAVVEVTVDGTPYDATNNGDGTWTLSAGTITALPEGIYTVNVTATDEAGNQGVLAATVDLTIDDAPLVTVNTLATSDQSPQLTGTVVDTDPTTVVTVTVAGIDYTAINNGDGTWTLANDLITPFLPDGTYDVSVSALDSGGNTGADSTSGELIIDTSTPLVTVDPLWTNDQTPGLTGTVSDSESAIEVTVDGISHAAVNNGDGTWTLADDVITVPLSEGVHPVTVTATNLAEVPAVGTDGTTDELTIDLTGPVVTVDSLTTIDPTPELTGTVTDADPAATILVTVNGVPYPATNNGDGTWTLPNNTIGSGLPVGTYDVTVNAVDAAGNLGNVTELSSLVIDPAPFTIVVTSQVTTDNTPKITGYISDPDATVLVTVDGVPYVALNKGDGRWVLHNDIITTPIADGVYDVVAAGTNLAAVTIEDDTTNELTIDATAPIVTVDPLSTIDTDPQLTGTVDDPASVISVTVNGVVNVATNNGDGTWALADNTINPPLPVGIYDVQVMGIDALGNTGTDTTIDELLIFAPTAASFDLSDLQSANGGDGTSGTVFTGVAGGDLSGNSASSAGDINGDGFDDLMFGAPGADPVGSNAGSVYIVFGQAGGFPAEFDLSTLNGTNGFRIDALVSGDDLGVSVASAGDVNGDGLDDLVIGASKADPNGNRSGTAYVVYGKSTPFAATLNLTTLDGSNGYRFDGAATSDRAGFSVSGLGDVNGDGLADVVIGSTSADDGVTVDTGRSYVIFGSTAAMPAVLTAGSLTGTNGLIITGPTTGDSAGFSVSSAGDMNGDGIADIRIGAPGSMVGANNSAGKTYVVFGQTSGFPVDFNLSTINGTNGFVIEGDAADQDLGFTGSAIGDFNGDGFGDLLIGAPASTDPASAGNAYVIFGQGAAFPTTVTLASLNGTNGFVIQGVDPGEVTGFNVSGVGDVNGDGFDDLLIGVHMADGGGFENGEAYLLFGRSGGFAATLSLASVSGNGGMVINGANVLDHAGRYVSGAGDVNGDGFADLLVAARDADVGVNNDAGETYLIYGRDFTGVVTEAGAVTGDTHTGSAARDLIIAGAGDDELVGNGGFDVLQAGEGDDVLAISDASFVRVAGGNGFDTLRLDGSGTVLDLTALSDHAMTGIEQIDIRGAGANSLTLDVREVLNLSDTTNTLLVLSDTGDTVDIGAGWTASGTEEIDGKTFDVFTQGQAVIKLFDSSDRTDPVVTVDTLTTSDTTPQLTGTVVDADPATTIEVTVNGIAYPATNNGDGTWTLVDGTIAPALAEGTHEVAVTATDTAGNTGSDATADELMVDSISPVVTVDALSTSDTTPLLTGTVVDADPATTVEVTVNGIAYPATNNGDGTWTLADNTITPALTEGLYDVAVSATDSASNVGSDVTTDELIIDSTAPVVTVDALTTSDTTPQLTGMIVDVDPATAIEVTVNGIAYPATNNGDGTWTLADDTITPGLAEGTYDVAVTATDTGSHVGSDATTDELVVDIDTTLPVVTVDALTTIDTTPRLTGTVVDVDLATTVEVTVNGIAYPATNNGDGTWTLADDTITPVLTLGTYDVAVTATDTANNMGSDATTDELVIELDIIDPVVTVDTLATSDTTPQLTGTIVDADPATTIEVTVNGIAYPATNNGDGTWTLADDTITPALGEGTHEVAVTATDTAGNMGSDATADELLVDSVAPVLTVDALSTVDTTPQLTGTVVDADPSTTVEVTVNGITYPATNNGDGTWTLADNTITPALAIGMYDVTVNAVDTVGNLGDTTGTSSLEITPAPFTISVTPQTTEDRTPKITGFISDPDATIIVTVNGIPHLAVNKGTGRWTLHNNVITIPLDNGVYDVVAAGTNLSAVTIEDSGTDELTIAATIPTVTVNPLSTSDTTPQLSGTVVDNDPDTTVDVIVNGITYPATNNGDGTWTLADDTIAPALVDGAYDVAVEATDTAGNTGYDSTILELEVDTAAPVVTVDTLTTTDATPQLTGTVVDDDSATTVEVTVNGVTHSAYNLGNGTWVLLDDTITPALSDGPFDVSVTATDTAGNIGSDTTTNELIVDTTAPVVTVDTLTTSDTTPQLTGTIVDVDPATTVEVTVNGIAYPATNNGDGTWTLADNTITPALAEGTYDVAVTATDTGSHVGSDATTDELTIESLLVGDLDNDGFVGITDLNIVLGNWNQTAPLADPRADVSGDDFVGIEDLNLVLGNWNAGTPPVAQASASSPAAEPQANTSQDQQTVAEETTQPVSTESITDKLSLLDEVAPVTEKAAEDVPAADRAQAAAAWSWLHDGDRGLRAAFGADGDDGASDSALDMALPVSDQSSISRL
jgi:hypothetical protein